MKANGSRREEEGGKNITEKIRCVPRSGEKNSRSVGGGWGRGGWRRSMRGAGAGRARVRTDRRRGRGRGALAGGTLAAAASLVARVPVSSSRPRVTRLYAASCSHRSRRRQRPRRRRRRATLSHVVSTTLYVQSAKVSASDCDRESDPAADLRAGPELHAAQG